MRKIQLFLWGKTGYQKNVSYEIYAPNVRLFE